MNKISEEIICKICNKKFKKSPSFLKNHLLQYHSITKDNYLNQFGENAIYDFYIPKKIERSTLEEVTCKICNKVFKKHHLLFFILKNHTIYQKMIILLNFPNKKMIFNIILKFLMK
jgi:hypothetical protein